MYSPGIIMKKLLCNPLKAVKQGYGYCYSIYLDYYYLNLQSRFKIKVLALPPLGDGGLSDGVMHRYQFGAVRECCFNLYIRYHLRYSFHHFVTR